MKTGREAITSNFILDETNLPQQIDHAMGMIKVNGEEHRYYGFTVMERKPKQGDESTFTIKNNPAILLDNGEIFTKYTKPDDVKFTFGTESALKKNRISLGTVRNFHTDNTLAFSFTEVFNDFKQSYIDAMVFEHNLWYDLNALWDMCTYFYDLIDKFLIIKHEGDSGTAKSKGMKISCNQSFNGRKFLCPTPANFFRYRNSNKATLYIEEAERLFDTSKRKNQGDSELVEYLNGSYEKGNYVPRQNPNDYSKTDEFDPAGFTRIGAINPLRGALEKRSITLRMIKAPPKDNRGNIEIPSETHSDYVKKRDKAYICALKNHKNYLDALEQVENKYDLSNRQWLVSKPIIAMAKCISYELESAIGSFLSKQFDIRDSSVNEDSWEVQLAYTLIAHYVVHEKGFISNQELVSLFQNQLELEANGYDKKITSNAITSVMKKISLDDFKDRNATRTKRGYSLDFWKICEILLRNEKITIEDVLKKVSKVSIRPITDEKIISWYTDNFTDNSTKLSRKIGQKGQTDTLYQGGVVLETQQKNDVEEVLM